jgi:Tol biopolymer transport system component
MRKPRAAILAITVALVALLAWPAMAQAETVELVSVDATGDGANGASQNSDMSADGRYVAFGSNASDLVAGDSNEVGDIFVRDRMFETTELVSAADGGSQANGASSQPSISPDGCYVAFQSYASNLLGIGGDTNGYIDVFVRDLADDAITRMSVASGGMEANGDSTKPTVTTDAEYVYVAYQSTATNLVDSDTNGNTSDVFLSFFRKSDLARTVETLLVSARNDGSQGARDSGNPSISGDGSLVAYESEARLDLAADSENRMDIYVTDWDKDDSGDFTTTLVSGPTIGQPCQNPSISADGRYVAFDSAATGLTGDPPGSTIVDVFVTELATLSTEKVSVPYGGGLEANARSEYPTISADGRYVAFESGASDLVAADSNGWRDIFVRDRTTETTYLLSTDFYGTAANNRSGEHYNTVDNVVGPMGPSITPSLGGVVPQVSFFSSATNLVSGDGNGYRDVFVGTIDTTPTITALSPTSGPTEGSTSVYVIGTNFVGLNGASAVTFGGFNALGYTPISTMKLLATAPAHTAGMVQVQVTAAGGKTQDTPADDYTYLAALVKRLMGHHRYEQTDLHLLYSGQWDTGSNNSHSAGSIYYSDDEEGTITITFKGNKLDWIAEMGPLMGKALVSIDGGEPVLVDLFSQTELLQQMVWSTGTLDYGMHVIKITFPTDSGSGENQTINIDALDVWGTLIGTTQS